MSVIEQLYQAELELKEGFRKRAATLNNSILKRNAAFNNLLASNDNLNAKFDYGFDLFSDIKIPTEILQNSSNNAMSGKITTFDRNKINAFFFDDFGMDISAVDVIESTFIPDNAEAFAMECSKDEHYICIPTRNALQSKKFLSYDLLIHELGHTVEFIERRKQNTPAEILNFSLFSETIAHYYQMSYMLKYSSSEDRLGMLTSVTQAYLFYHCMKIMRRVAPQDKIFSRMKISKDGEFQSFLSAYQGTNILDNFFKRWHLKDYLQVYEEEYAKRLGVFLALNFIRYNLDIKELFKTQYPKGDNIRLEDIIIQTNLDKDILFDFSDIDETIKKFVKGDL